MKIVISHVYSSDNKGDAALVSVLLQDIKRQYPHAETTILTFENTEEKPFFEDTKQLPSFMQLALTTFQNKLIKLFYSIFIMIITLLWALVLRYFHIRLWLPKKLRATADIYEQSDLIIPVGGGYIRSGTSIVSSINLALLLHPLAFGKILNKPTVLYTQSVGPFYRTWERHAVARLLRQMDLVILRENTSKDLLTNLGVTKNVIRSVDSGFLLQGNKKMNLRKKLGVAKNQLFIGVTVRKWLDSSKQSKYESAIAHAVDYVISKYNAKVVFLPQVTDTFHGDDDRKASNDVFEKLKYKHSAHVITDNLTHHEIKSMYNELDMIIGTRFHSVIFSLTSHVPALAIEYEHKTSGIMNDLELNEWVIKIEDVNPKVLKQKIDVLINERSNYSRKLREVLPVYIQEAQNAIVLTDKAYQASLRR